MTRQYSYLRPTAFHKDRRRFLSLIAAGMTLSFALMRQETAAQTKPRRFELNIRNGGLVESSNVIRVTQGDEVELYWTADAPSEIHLHSYDIKETIRPDAPGTTSFHALATGRFPISLHGHARASETKRNLRGHGQRNLLYLEVRPR